MSFIQEFKIFISKGNVMDLAIGVIIGGAFGKIVSSLVSDVLMPILGILLGKVNLTQLKLTVGDGFLGGAPVVISYGTFLQSLFDFLIMAFALFLIIKGLNRVQRSQEKKSEGEAAPILPKEELLLAEIRDILARQERSRAA
jgi:large conductance mechanosensitive channel